MDPESLRSSPYSGVNRVNKFGMTCHALEEGHPDINNNLKYKRLDSRLRENDKPNPRARELGIFLLYNFMNFIT